jgi:hypothetical protein
MDRAPSPSNGVVPLGIGPIVRASPEGPPIGCFREYVVDIKADRSSNPAITELCKVQTVRYKVKVNESANNVSVSCFTFDGLCVLSVTCLVDCQSSLD